MYSETTERVTASIPPLSILIEYRQDAWHAKIGPDDNPTAHTVGTFESFKEAKTAVLARITDEFKKDDKVLPPTITWTSVKAMLPESNVNKSVRKVSSEVVPVIIGAVGLVMSLYVWGIGKTPGASLSSVADVLKLSVQIADTRTELRKLKEAIEAPSTNSNPSDLSAVKSDVKSLKERFAGFETALGESLDKRLAVPMLRKDLDSIKEQYKGDLAAVDARLSLVVDLMKWLLGIIGLGGLASGLSNWLARPKFTTGTVQKP